MACSTCDDYCYVDGDDDVKVECPDCHAHAVRAWCPVHSVRLDEVGRCRKCLAEATRGIALLDAQQLLERAREAVLEAA